MDTPKFTFERVVRDCPHNDSCTDARQIIYDFDVIIAGERRAVLRRNVHGRGYDVVDAELEAIYVRPVPPNTNAYYHQAKVEKQADFVSAIDGLLLSNRIPTVEDTKARLIGWGRALLETRDAKFQENLTHAVKEHARSFYDLAMLVADGVDCRRGANTLLDKVQARHKEFNDHQDEFYPPNKWEAAAIAAFTASLKGGES